MAINFPDSPTNGQSATLGGNTWTYNSTSGAWARASSAGGSSITTYDSTTDLPLSGVSAGDQAFVTGSNRMYVSNGAGWYSVSLVNTNPSITSVQDSDGGSTPFTLATDGTGTVITITASDPEDVPLTYGYSVTSGSLTNGGGTTATVVQGTDSDVNKFTITPTTTEAYAGNFELTFTASDGINQGTNANNFTLQFIIIVANSRYTTLLATGTNGTAKNYHLLGASYDSITLDTSSEGTGYQVFAFNNDGTKLFRIDSTIIYQYTLTTGFDLSTGSYDNISFTIPSNQGNAARAIQFNNDGTKMYVYTSSNTRISQYALTAGFDLGSASYDNKLYNGTTGNSGFTFNNDGTKLFKATASSKTIETYNLSSAFDISTASDASDSFSTASQTTGTAFQVQFNSDGTKMFVMDWVDAAGNNIYQYTLTQPYVVSSASYDNINYNYNNQESGVNDFKFSNDGSKMYIGGFATDRIHQYSTVSHDNKNITDSSSNNHSITVNGDAHAGTFSPYRSGGYSTYFDGTTNTYLYVSSSSGGVAIGSGDFTISFWVYSDDVTSNNNYLLDYRPLNFNTGNHPVIYIQTDGTFRYKIAGTEVITGNTAISSKQWVYFCLARDNGTTKMYVNGTLQSATYSGTESLTNGSNRPVIGAGAYNISPMFNGYISDLRVVTSLDTTAYPVPTKRMSAINNTQLLTCHLPYITDGSTNNHSITVNGNTTTKPFSPYDYEEYDAADHGGSVYLDGTGDYLTLPQIALGSGNFTIEAWTYLESRATTYPAIFSNYNSFSAGSLSLFAGHGSSTTTNYQVAHNGSGFPAINAGTVSYDQWVHLALVRNNGTITLYKDGTSVGSFTSSADLSGVGSNFYIGAAGDNISTGYINGYISDFRLVTGNAVYTGNFTPPTAPLSSSGASLHIKGTDASIIDKSQSANLKLVGNATGSTTQVKFANTKSIYFDGGNSVLEIPAPGVLLPPQSSSNVSMDWTIEGWLYRTSADGQNGTVGDGIFAVNSYDEWDEYPANSNINGLSFSTKGLSIGQNTSSHALSTQFTADNQWHHFALVRYYDTSGGSTYVNVYRDGTSVLQLQDAADGYLGFDNVNTPSAFGVFDKYNGSYRYYFQGYMQDLRISRRAVYTGAFTPPTASLEG